MTVRPHATIETFHLPGIAHQTLASLEHGIYTMEVWRQTLAPGATTPWHQHACEEVVVVLQGRGECRQASGSTSFGADCTLIIAPDVQHQLANTSTEDVVLIAMLGMTPVAVQDANGQPLPLPWNRPPGACDGELRD